MATHGKRSRDLIKILQLRLDEETYEQLDDLRRWRKKPSVAEWVRSFIAKEQAAFEQRAASRRAA